MNRRGFLGMMIGGVAASAAVRTFPFRVYSFPAEPVIVPFSGSLTVEMLRRAVKLFESNPLAQMKIIGITSPDQSQYWNDLFCHSDN